ncbi:MAG: DUF4249 family protein [Porphyromonadaceae bacterium]|nr:MAG: DUF4249 family protein [Porphyromonadaceae bacterium]
MMRIRSGLWALLVAVTGCTTEIDLIVPGDPLPVVYCLLDPEDSIQYVRVGSTYTVNPGDSIFKPAQEKILIDEDILVYLSAEYSDRQQEVFYASRIDTIPKDAGWFPSSVNQLYAIPCIIKPNTRYSLYIHFTGSKRIVHGETVSLGSLFTIIDPDIVPGREATLLPGIDFFVRFYPVANGSIFQSTMTFRYADIKAGQWTNRSLVLPQKFVYEDDTTVNYAEQRISGERFLIDVSRALKSDPDIRRVPLGLDFHISCGGDDLALKINAENNTQSFSILEVNSFDNAIGVFSCLTHRYIKDVPLSRFTLDTLALGPLTRNLGFLTAEQIDSLNYEKH